MRPLWAIFAVLVAAASACADAVVAADQARIRTTGGAVERGWNLWSNGTLGDWFHAPKAGKVVVVIRAAGIQAAGEWPRASVQVGNASVAEFTASSADDQEYRFEVDRTEGPFAVLVTFLNDYFQAGEDRNLLLREVRLEGADLLDRVPSVKDLTEADVRRHRVGTIVVETAPGARVKVEQLRHEFGFGTALANHLFQDETPEETRRAYERLVVDNFNGAVFENALKWYCVEPEEGKLRWETADRIVGFCEANRLELRGHCLFWAVDQFVQPWVQALDKDALSKTVSRHVRDVVGRYRGRIPEYDVNNEMLHGQFFEKRLGPEVNVRMFQLAHEVDPDALLYVNDYNILNGAEVARYEEQIAWLLDAGAPVGGIGCQEHYEGGVAPYSTLTSSLNRLARFGLPIRITEFDIDTADEAKKARGLEDFFRACFAHPSVTGIWQWGFWEGAHWRPRAALWRKDFSPTPAAEVYRRLVYGEWWTRWEGTADVNGRCEVPAFFGSHRVEANGAGDEVVLARRDGTTTVRLGLK